MDHEAFKRDLISWRNKQRNQSAKGIGELQPWQDEPQSIPLSLFSTDSRKRPVKNVTSFKMNGTYRSVSHKQIFSQTTSFSPKKERKISILPKTNIGNFQFKAKNTETHLKKESDSVSKMRSVSNCSLSPLGFNSVTQGSIVFPSSKSIGYRSVNVGR